MLFVFLFRYKCVRLESDTQSSHPLPHSFMLACLSEDICICIKISVALKRFLEKAFNQTCGAVSHLLTSFEKEIRHKWKVALKRSGVGNPNYGDCFACQLQFIEQKIAARVDDCRWILLGDFVLPIFWIIV